MAADAEKFALEGSAEAKQIARLERKLEAKTGEVTRLKRRATAAEEERSEAEKLYAGVLELAERPVEPLRVHVRPAKDRSRVCPVILASDWHVDEVVDPRTVRNMNEYSPEIASARAERFFQKIVRLVNLRRKQDEISELVLWLGGDFVTAYLHDEARETNSMGPFEAKAFAMDLLIGGLDYLLARSDCERILLPCNVGNHGRITKEIRTSTIATTNHEWELYNLLARHFKKEKRLEWQISRGPDLVFDVYGFKIRGTHGQEIRYMGGVGGIAVPLNRAIGSTMRADPVNFDILAHHHSLNYSPLWMINGSLIGYAGYPLYKRLPYDPPQQGMFFVDQERKKISSMAPIWVE